MVKVRAIKSDNIVTPHEYIDEDNNVVNAMTTARDKEENVFVVFKNNKYEVRLLPKQEFLEKYEYCLSEVTISVNPESIERVNDNPEPKHEDDDTVILRDEAFDAFAAFQSAAKKEIGVVDIDNM